MRDKIQNVLVGVDFSEFSERALRAAVALALQTGASVDVMHAVDVGKRPPVDPFVTAPIMQYLIERIAEGAGKQVEALQNFVERVVAGRVETRLHRCDGFPGQCLLSAIRKLGSDLVVIGSHGEGGLLTNWLGSVSQFMCDHSPVPVLVVPASGRGARS